VLLFYETFIVFTTLKKANSEKTLKTDFKHYLNEISTIVTILNR